jgi:hypothetical protein
MTLKNRLAKVEKAKRAKEPEEYQVWLCDEAGYRERTAQDGTKIRLSPTEWEEHLRQPDVTVIAVKPEDDLR